MYRQLLRGLKNEVLAFFGDLTQPNKASALQSMLCSVPGRPGKLTWVKIEHV